MSFYTDSQQHVQQRLDCQPLADRMAAAIVADEIADQHRSFIESRDFFFLSTVNGAGEPTVSYKGGGVGLVSVLSTRELVFPSYDGNGMCLSMGNIAETSKIGMLFIDFETPHRLRVQATARLSFDDELLERYPGADLIVRAGVDQVFVNCARMVHPHERKGISEYVPDDEGTAPLPAWKRISGFGDVLRPGDAERVDEAGGTIDPAEYQRRLRTGTS